MALGSVHCRELCLTLTALAAELGWLGGDWCAQQAHQFWLLRNIGNQSEYLPAMCVSIFLGTDLATEAVKPQNCSPSGLPSRGSCLAQSPHHHCYGPGAASPKPQLSHGHNTNPTGMTGSSWIFFPRSFPGNWGTERNVRIWKLVKLICYGFTIFTVAVCLTVLLSQKISLLNIDSSTSCFLPSPPSGQGSQAQSPAKA